MQVRSRAMSRTVLDKLDELTGDQPDSGANVSAGASGPGRGGGCLQRFVC